MEAEPPLAATLHGPPCCSIWEAAGETVNLNFFIYKLGHMIIKIISRAVSLILSLNK